MRTLRVYITTYFSLYIESHMKKSIVAILGLAGLVTAATALGQDAKMPVPTPMPAAQSAAGVDSKAQMVRMDEQLKMMQTLHEKMMSAKTPKERQRLMEEQRKSMQEGMGMMNQMTQGEGTMGGMTAQKGAPADPGTSMSMMGTRMDMMQMMMDQQGMATGPKSAAPAPKK